MKLSKNERLFDLSQCIYCLYCDIISLKLWISISTWNVRCTCSRLHTSIQIRKDMRIFWNFYFSEVFNFLKLHLLGIQLIWRTPSQKCVWIVCRFSSILSSSHIFVGKSQNCLYSKRYSYHYSQQLKKKQLVCGARDWSSVNLPKLILIFNQCTYHYSWVYFGRRCLLSRTHYFAHQFLNRGMLRFIINFQ